MHDDDNIGGSHHLRGEELQVGRAWSGENILFGLVRFFLVWCLVSFFRSSEVFLLGLRIFYFGLVRFFLVW